VTVMCWLALATRSSSSKDVEILAPRAEVVVLSRANPRPRISRADRAVLACAVPCQNPAHSLTCWVYARHSCSSASCTSLWSAGSVGWRSVGRRAARATPELLITPVCQPSSLDRCKAKRLVRMMASSEQYEVMPKEVITVRYHLPRLPPSYRLPDAIMHLTARGLNIWFGGECCRTGATERPFGRGPEGMSAD
jgi:hypothetical protein